jgi:putative hydrolase of the HAD superfamily
LAAKWLIFDADNTLWDIETLYDRARLDFCAFLLDSINERGHNSHGYLSLELIEKAQRHRDLQLYRTLGYSSNRFAKSFEDTACFFFAGCDAGILARCSELAQNVFHTVPTLSMGLEALLARLEQSFKLGIITAGDDTVQRRRLEQFRLYDHFHAVQIVSRKSASVFDEFCSNNDVDKSSSWVIGDSIKSDILPAIEAGLKTIHLKSANWAAEHDQRPNDTIEIHRLADVWNTVSGGSESER